MPHIATLFFDPLDVLVFRDHRPFMAGQHFLARSVFPLPSVFFGALRTALFERVGVRFNGRNPFAALRRDDPDAHALLGDAESPGALRLQGPLLACRENHGAPPRLFLPWPGDLDVGPNTQPKDAPGPEPELLGYPVYPCESDNVSLRWRSNGTKDALTRLPWLPRSDRPRDSKPGDERLLLTQAGAVAYARAAAAGERSLKLFATSERTPEESSEIHYVKESEVLTKERRSGIMRTRGGEGEPDPLTVEESMLYTIETWRLTQNAGFVVELALDDRHDKHARRLRGLVDELDGAVLRLGGKGHLARITCSQDGPSPLASLRQELTESVPSETSPACHKVWNLTPSLLDPADERVKAVLGETLRLGGVNLGGPRRGPRPLIGALAPGSVLFIDGAADLDELVRRAEALGEKHGHLHQAGYGLYNLLPCPLNA